MSRRARLALLACLFVAAGCAAHGHARPAPAAPPPAAAEPAPTPPPAPPAPDTSLARQPVPAAGAPIASPWDTAATANGRQGQRNHVYPSGVSAIGRRLVDSLPDPAGVKVEEAAAQASPAPSAPAVPATAPSIGESGCWEVQLLVTTDKGRADALRKQVTKQQNLAAWVRQKGALYRVRAGGCLSPDGASELARTLKAKGYPEAFRVMRESP